MVVSKKLLQSVINESAKTGCDFVEVFVEDTTNNNMAMIGGKMEQACEDHITGVGLRLALGYKQVYGYTNKTDRKSLLKLAEDLRASFNEEPKEVTPLKSLKKGTHHKAKILPEEVTNAARSAVIERAYNAAKNYSEEISQATIRLGDTKQEVWIAKMDGTYVYDQRVYTRLACQAVASNGDSMESGFFGPGRAKGFEVYEEEINPEEAGKEAARIAVVNLHAEECPSGEMPVIIDNGFGGVIFHEAVGHSLEATSVAWNSSVFCGKLNEKVAHSCVTAIDDGTIEGDWGSANYDDEGHKQKKRVLIKNGKLVSYMVDEINGRKMGVESTGSGRRESYKYAPTSRMSNTYIAKGKSTLEEMLATMEYGLYCRSMGGGSVNPATGDFNFAVTEAYLVKNGKIDHAVKGASLIGNGKDVLSKIDMVGNNLKLAQGRCGSQSGSIPTNVGQPAIRVSKITVGGRKAQ